MTVNHEGHEAIEDHEGFLVCDTCGFVNFDFFVSFVVKD